MTNKTDLHISKMDNEPNIHYTCFTAPGSKIIGNVTLSSYSSVWYNSVLRGDINAIRIGHFTNIQDNCMIHLENDLGCIIGDYVTVGHNAILHGCIVHNFALIGMGAIVLNGAEIGEGAVIGAGAVVKEHTKVAPFSLYAGIPAQKRKQYNEDMKNQNKKWAEKYVNLAKIHQENCTNKPKTVHAP